MKLDRQQLEKIKSAIDFIINKYEEFADYEEDLRLQEEDIEEFITNGYEVPAFPFPGEQENIEIETEYFLEIIDEITSIKIESNGLVKTDKLSYYIVEISDSNQEHMIRDYHDLKLQVNEGIEIDVVFDDFIIGLAATELGEYDSDYYGTVSPYIAIRLKYLSKDFVLKAEQELSVVNSFIFEVADSTSIALNLSEIRSPEFDYENYKEESRNGSVKQLRELEVFNEGMQLFTSAVQIHESELKFFNFYKILEYFAPIAVNIEANELMRKKLDAPKAQLTDGSYIRSIFSLAKAMREKFNDEDLIKSTFSICFDFIGIFAMLPESIKVKVKKQLAEREIDYSTNKDKVVTAISMVGKIIYSTRNGVVHAKSNFQSTGNECDESDLDELNVFMKEACSQTIRWYNRQPQHLKLEVVK